MQISDIQKAMEQDCDKNVEQIIAVISEMVRRDCAHTKALMQTLKYIISDYEKGIRI